MTEQPNTTDPTSSEVEQRARELLATEYDRQGDDVDARCMRRPAGPFTKIEEAALRAIIAALRTGSGVADGYALVPVQPTEAMAGGLARAIVMWMDMGEKTPRALFEHLKRSGEAIPQWLRDEPEMKALHHVPSKGTRAVLIYKAMLAAAKETAQ